MQSIKRTIATGAMIAATLSMIKTLGPTGQAFADDNNGLVVPMCGWDTGWSDVSNAKHENKRTEIIVIVNPSRSPRGSKYSHWTDVTHALRDAGIKVVSYVARSYAGKSTGEAKDEVDRCYDWYDLDGVFFGETNTSDHSYHKEIRDDGESCEGSQTTILNPGAQAQKSYKDAGDVIIAYQNSGIPSHVDSNGISESKLGARTWSRAIRGRLQAVSREREIRICSAGLVAYGIKHRRSGKLGRLIV